MRLKEPFRGLYLVGGHSVFHFALLIVSFLILGFPETVDSYNEEYNKTVNLLRVAHAIDWFFAILKFLGSSPQAYSKHCFTYKILDTIKMVFYLGAILYAIFHETHIDTNEILETGGFWIRHAEVWIRIELIVFFMQILCSSLYLFIVQIRGELGRNNDPNHSRYLNDTLRYYNDDLAWFSYSFVCLCFHCWLLNKYIKKPSKDDADKKMTYTCFMIGFSLLRLFFLMPYKTSDRRFNVISNCKWMTLLILETVGAAFFLTFNRVATSNTFASCLIDSLCLLSSFFIYKINEVKMQIVPEDEGDNEQEGTAQRRRGNSDAV